MNLIKIEQLSIYKLFTYVAGGGFEVIVFLHGCIYFHTFQL